MTLDYEYSHHGQHARRAADQTQTASHPCQWSVSSQNASSSKASLSNLFHFLKKRLMGVVVIECMFVLD